MIFIAAAEEPTMFLLLTEQDVNDMRIGRSKYVDRSATAGRKFDKLVLGLFKNQAEIEEGLRKAGHGKLLEGMPSPVPEPRMGVCAGCQGNMLEVRLLQGKCIACWCESAQEYRRRWLDEVSKGEP